jgi:signal transduction histidine kinase
MTEPDAISSAVVRRFTHDVVSPLMSVMALTEVLMLEARNDDRLNEDLRRIHAAADEALSLVRALSAELRSKGLGSDH